VFVDDPRVVNVFADLLLTETYRIFAVLHEALEASVAAGPTEIRSCRVPLQYYDVLLNIGPMFGNDRQVQACRQVIVHWKAELDRGTLRSGPWVFIDPWGQLGGTGHFAASGPSRLRKLLDELSPSTGSR
jgi:hypothetical protein